MASVIASHPRPIVTVTALLVFLAILLFSAAQTPLTFDEGFNGSVAQSFARGLGFATHVEGGAKPFNPVISSGVLFIAPLAGLLLLTGPSILAVQLYSLAVTLALFALALVFAGRIHRALPLAFFAAALAFVFEGKTDLVPAAFAPNMPSPPYGLWFQFLGNLAGTWALIAALFVSLSPKETRYPRLLPSFLLAAFACNAKLVHALPLVVGAATLILLSPRRYALSTGVLLFGAFIGSKVDPWLAYLTLDPEGFSRYTADAALFFADNQGTYLELVRDPSLQGVFQLGRNIAAQAMKAVVLVGEFPVLLGATLLGGLFISTFRGATLPEFKRLTHLALAFAGATTALILWWASLPSAPVRFITTVPPLIAATVSTACIALICVTSKTWQRVVIGLFSLTVLGALYTNTRSAFPRWAITRAVRAEQLQAASMVRDRFPKHPLCGAGWWYPHEVALLSGTVKMQSCAEAHPRLVVIPVLPQRKMEIREALLSW